MIYLSQKDPRWSYVRMGNSSSTIGGYGCLITSLSMLSSWYGKYRHPEWMANNLSFTNGGLLFWRSITDSELPMKFVYRYYQRNDAKMKEILKSANGSCVVEVALGTGRHWLPVIGHSAIFGFKVVDPLRGDSVYLNKRYPRITGFAELTRK